MAKVYERVLRQAGTPPTVGPVLGQGRRRRRKRRPCHLLGDHLPVDGEVLAGQPRHREALGADGAVGAQAIGERLAR